MKEVSHRADVHEDGTVSLWSDIPGVMEMKIAHDRGLNPVVQSVVLSGEEVEKMRHKLKTHHVVYSHKEKRFIYHERALIS